MLSGLDCRTLVSPISARFCALRRRQNMHPQLAGSFRRGVDSNEKDNIGDTPAADEQQVGRNGGLGILMRLADCALYINIKTSSVNITTHQVTQHLLEEVHP